MKENVNRKDEIRTIITKAVLGQVIQTCQKTIFLNINPNIEPAQILDCNIKSSRIKSHKFEQLGDNLINVRIEGEFEVHVRCEVNGNTRVSRKIVKFSELIPIESRETVRNSSNHISNVALTTWINKEPISQGNMIVNRAGVSQLSLQLEYEIGVEIIGDAKIDILSVYEENEVIFDNDIEDLTDYDDVD